jgi:hypothetical protein
VTVAPTSDGIGTNRPDQYVYVLGRQMPGQSSPISLRNARNAQGKIARRLADVEEISKKVPQMRGEGLFPERWFTRHLLLQKIHDVARPDLRQIPGFLSKAESKEAVGDAPVMEDRSLAQPR